MSLIYEALEKAEQEKKGPERKTGARVETTAPPLPKPKTERAFSFRNDASMRTLYAIGGTLLFLFAAALVYLLVDSLQKERSGTIKKLKSPFSLSVRSSKQPFSLTGITRMGAGWTAIVNNQLVRAGEEVGGARVESIREDQVVLQWKGETLTLSLYGEKPAHLARLEKPE